MKIVVWILMIVPIVVVLGFLHFYLPSSDVVRVVDTDVKRMDVVSRDFVAEDAGERFARTRDVRFINAVWPDGPPRVYRNEETGWGFPWYFKFDSGNLQTEAQDLRSTAEAPNWVVVTHYGWRIEILSMFPNAVAIERVDGPDHFPVPWFRISFFALLGGLLFWLWWLWRRFYIRRWQPFIAGLELDERFDNASTAVGQVWRWFRANAGDRRRRRRPPGSEDGSGGR